MYDFDTHMRFMRSAMDAWFNYTTAATAACGAWQDQVSNQLGARVESKPAAPASPYEQAFSWWTNMFMPHLGQQKQSAQDFGAGFFQFSPMHNLYTGFDFMKMFSPFHGFAAPSAQMSNPWASNWMEAMMAYSRAMPQFSWTIFQAPMTAWLMAAGMPYSVAAPTARGNAASMDAAIAVQQGFDKMYSSFRTDGGHASSPAVSAMQPMTMFLAPYFMVPKTVH